MAIREFRYNFKSLDKNLTRRLHFKYGGWIPGFKNIMKGKHKEFSGPEVKGMNIVNLNLCDNTIDLTNGFHAWAKLLNTIEIELPLDLSKLDKIDEIEGFQIIFDIYTEKALSSNIPQVAKMPHFLIGNTSKVNVMRLANKTKKEHKEFFEYINSI